MHKQWATGICAQTIRVSDLIMANRRIAFDKPDYAIGLPHETQHIIIHVDLKKSAQWVLHCLILSRNSGVWGHRNSRCSSTARIWSRSLCLWSLATSHGSGTRRQSIEWKYAGTHRTEKSRLGMFVEKQVSLVL